MILLICIQLGIMPVNNFQMWDYSAYPCAPDEILEQYLSVDFEFYPLEFFYIGGEVQTDFFARTWHNFVPSKMGYLFKAGIVYNGFTLGFEHYCQHAIIPNMRLFDPGDIHFEGAMEKIFVEYKGEFRI